MAYRFRVNENTCINCGICMDLCPVRCLDMSRPSGEGEIGNAQERLSPIPGPWADRAWMMLGPVQVASCIGCQVCAQECPTNAITIEGHAQVATFAQRGLISYLPDEGGWQPLDAYTRATPEEPGETRHARDRQRADQERPVRDRQVLPQAAHVPQVLLPVQRVNHRSGTQSFPQHLWARLYRSLRGRMPPGRIR